MRRQIVSVNIKEGQSVNTGDILLKIDSRKYESSIELSESNLVNTNDKLKINLAQLMLSKSLLLQNYISQQQLNHMKPKWNKILQISNLKKPK